MKPTAKGRGKPTRRHWPRYGARPIPPPLWDLLQATGFHLQAGRLRTFGANLSQVAQFGEISKKNRSTRPAYSA